MDEADGPSDDGHRAGDGRANGDDGGVDGEAHRDRGDEEPHRDGGEGEMPARDSDVAPAGWVDVDAQRPGASDPAATDDEREGNVAGALAPDVPVEAGRPDPANVVFVVVGAYVGVLAVAALIGSGGGLSLFDYGTLTVAFLAFAALVYGFFARGNPDT